MSSTFVLREFVLRACLELYSKDSQAVLVQFIRPADSNILRHTAPADQSPTCRPGRKACRLATSKSVYTNDESSEACLQQV